MYYVYVLHNPLNLSPFYVGKGKGKRMYDHERKTRRGQVPNHRNGYLYHEIKSIIAAGFRPIYEIVEDGMTEIDALALESAFIEHFGIDNLCNIRRDGFQGHKPPSTAETIAKIKATNSSPQAVAKARESAVRTHVKNHFGSSFGKYFCWAFDKQLRAELCQLDRTIRRIRRELTKKEREKAKQEKPRHQLWFNRGAIEIDETKGIFVRRCRCGNVVNHGSFLAMAIAIRNQDGCRKCPDYAERVGVTLRRKWANRLGKDATIGEGVAPLVCGTL
jgi:hypothetical protein